MAGLLITLVVAVGLIALLVHVMGSKDHYSKMTEQEFEEESQKKTLIGSALVGLELAWRRREAEQVMETRTRIERDATPSPGDPPEPPVPESPEKN
ncbi:MAG TPA: hypothetical protein VEI73_12160 [Candidatus Acidoferrum sp.]|nr:hypothetical protein [Candidatus Acidoferrum sp.]